MNQVNSNIDSTVAEIVTDDFRTVEVFKRYGIDFCCGGKKSIARVCSEKNLDVKVVEEELSAIKNRPAETEHNFAEWKLAFLADYIVNVHHQYVNNNLALIGGFADKVARVHGHHDTETVEINSLWKEIEAELTDHMKKEELLLFPYIKNLEQKADGLIEDMPKSHFGTVKNPVRMMEHEHENVGNSMHRIQFLSNNFTPPDYACNTYKVLYAKLKEFSDDLHLHIHLENNILFPKSVKLEENLFNIKVEAL
ncbi:iron-sulfur cluster repair di-iron protein [uncultured Mucilaginibacter sp.]|uniref:iron-sulfur cluster repair di-iron protein n=1 Tax=uncultured Mucilaginibacter sp. TaxID=797541 RepID=UPI0025E80E7D|nr:iron-sulfur cluster repair di-iron protein [uncultured Mucilaginibacter sp.]